MKIEKISDNQIRCTLTRQDLEERNIRLTELCYGTEKAKALFRDMMIQAHKLYGWTNEANIPIMIEAIPNRENNLVLIITKVEDPEELDTRFSRFTATDEVPDGAAAPVIEGADDILDLFRHFMDKKAAASGTAKNAAKNAGEKKSAEKSAEGQPEQENRAAEAVSLSRVFRLASLDDAILAASAIRNFFCGGSSLYRSVKEKEYLLIIHQESHSPEDFNRVCNILSEYGKSEVYNPAAEAYLAEHGEVVMAAEAVGHLASIRQ